MTHSWMPSSPCDAGCLPRLQECVNRLTVLVRKVAVVTAVSVLPLLLLIHVLPLRARHAVIRASARTLLTCIGIRVRVTDARSPSVKARTKRGSLIVAGHISWIDILVLAAVRPATFVARADLVAWPLLGKIARAVRIVPIARERLRDLPLVVEQVADRLRAGGSVVVFPEATTWCGRAHGTFRPALFQAAVDAEAWVQPMRVTYVDRRGDKTTGPCFVGEESIGQSISRILRHRGTCARVVFGSPQVPGLDRHDLARRAEREVRGSFDFGIGRQRVVRDTPANIGAELHSVSIPVTVPETGAQRR